MDERLWQVFLEVHRDLPRQAPGCDESTLRALGLCRGLADSGLVLDVGCGPGQQSLVLARSSAARVVAVDLFHQYLDELRASAAAAGLERRIDIVQGDMRALPFGSARFDLVWAEGSAYVMGVGDALASWRRLLVPRGYLAFTELVWLVDEPPEVVREFFAAEYPAMRGIEAIAGIVAEEGFELIGHFGLPEVAWWRQYYTPLEARLRLLREKYSGDGAALGVIAAAELEIEMRRRFPAAYGYEFFVTRRR